MPIRVVLQTSMSVGLAMFVVGCHKTPNGRCEVSGSIRGLETQRGVMSFVPEPGTDGPAVRTSFENGRYAFEAEQSPKPGVYAVLVWVTLPETPDASVPLDEVKRRLTELGEPQTSRATVPNAAQAVIDIELHAP